MTQDRNPFSVGEDPYQRTSAPIQPYPAPPKRSLRNRLLVIAIIVGIILIAVTWYASSNQDLYVVNGMKESLSAEIDGRRVSVRPGRAEKIVLAEGAYQAVVKGESGYEETIDFTMKNGFFARLFSSGVFVLNPGGAATVLWEEIPYSANRNATHEPKYELHFDKFFRVKKVDYPFQKPPQEIKMSSKTGVVVKTHLEITELDPLAVLAYMPDDTPEEKRLEFIENHLKLDRSNKALLRSYIVEAYADRDTMERCTGFLAQGLDARPVSINWHRYYQGLAKECGREDTVIERYDRMLAAAPDDSALLYLKARLTDDPDEAFALYDRSIAADPSNMYPLLAKSHHLFSRGELEQALDAALDGERITAEDEELNERLFDLRFALGKYEELQYELEGKLRNEPRDIMSRRRLMQVCVALRDVQRAERLQRELADIVKEEMPGDPGQVMLSLKLGLLAMTGDTAGGLRTAQELKDEGSRDATVFAFALEAGDMARAAGLLDKLPEAGRAQLELTLSFGHDLAGDAAKSKARVEAAVALFEKGTREDRRIASLLKADAPPTPDALRRVIQSPPEQATILIALARRFPEKRAEFLAVARKLNFDLAPVARVRARMIDKLQNDTGN